MPSDQDSDSIGQLFGHSSEERLLVAQCGLLVDCTGPARGSQLYEDRAGEAVGLRPSPRAQDPRTALRVSLANPTSHDVIRSAGRPSH